MKGDEVENAASIFQALYRAVMETDASLVEINPLIVTGEGKLVALDAKMVFDDNALYRHPELKELRELTKKIPSKWKLQNLI